MNPRFHKHTQKGFSLVEVAIIIAVLSIIILIAVLSVSKVRPAVEKTKLQTDVSSVNTAIKLYKNSGGILPLGLDAPAVIAKLKTVRDRDTVSRFVGFTGSTIDPRTTLVAVNATEKGERAIYLPDKQKFTVTSDSVAGYRFRMRSESAPSDSMVEETRTESSLQYASETTWVWDYDDADAPDKLDPTLVGTVAPGLPPSPGPIDIDSLESPNLPGLKKLLPPTFSIPTGNYEIGGFPMTLELTNPNEPGSGDIIYGVLAGGDWEWQTYSGPIEITPADKVIAFVKSNSPKENHNSNLQEEFYDWNAGLEPPSISVSPDEIDARTGSTTVTITHSNDPNHYQWGLEELEIPANAFEVQYKLVPLVPGEGTETSWQKYEGPFSVGGPQFPKGFQVVSKVIGISSNLNTSEEARETVDTFYTLDPPLITSSTNALINQNDFATISIDNPNPNGSSEIDYQIVDHLTGIASNWIAYNGPFQLYGSQHPKGFSIVAKAVPLDPYYRESETDQSDISVTFFGIEVTGKTVFVLDNSGSMGAYNRIDRLKEAALDVLDLFGPNEQFAVISYESAPNVLVPWGAGSPQRIDTAESAITGMIALGGTNYGTALQSADQVHGGQATQVIFLSDGYPNEGAITPEEILPLVDQLVAPGGIRLDTISLGVSQSILTQMADRGHGDSVVVPDED